MTPLPRIARLYRNVYAGCVARDQQDDERQREEAQRPMPAHAGRHTAARPAFPTWKPLRAGLRERLADRPRVAGAEQRLQVAVALGVLELRGDELVVALARDVTEDADRDRAVRLVRHARKRESSREVGLVVRDASVSDRLALLQIEAVLLLVSDEVERAVVVDVAILEDLDERGAAMGGRAAQNLGEPRLVGVD